MKGPVVILGAILATMISTQAVAGSAAVASISSAPTGGRMYEAQALLHSMGFQPGHLDGYYGPRTAAAIKAFQKQEELPATGSLDEKTLERLEKILEWFRSDVSTLPLRDESATKPGPDDEMRENVIQLYSSAMVAGEDERLASVDLL
ncbi:MAG TPA: peptidoglycan-binding domain-containing protein, partial [bacterium]|nr:peptidoglycan-binding domain-containing protein [bacterium]